MGLCLVVVISDRCLGTYLLVIETVDGFDVCQVGVDAASVSETHYKNLLTKLPGGQDALHGAYEMIEKIVRDVDGYVRVSSFDFWFSRLQLLFCFRGEH